MSWVWWQAVCCCFCFYDDRSSGLEFALLHQFFLCAPPVPPHVPSCDVPSSVFVGSGLELHCKDKLSVPPATYRWYKDNRALTATADTPYLIDMKRGTLVRKYQNALSGGWKRLYTDSYWSVLFLKKTWSPSSLFGTEIKQRVQNGFRDVPLWVLQQRGGAQELCGPAITSPGL